jgi:hypothetical protein
MSQRNASVGFLLAPLVPSFIFAFCAFLLGALGDSLHQLPITTYLFGMLIWFLYAIVVAYPVTLIIGIPGYLIYKRLGFKSFKSYLIGGCILGGLAPLVLMPIFGIYETLNFNLWIFFISGFFGAVTCVTFWLIVIKNPNKTLNSDAGKDPRPLT